MTKQNLEKLTPSFITELKISRSNTFAGHNWHEARVIFDASLFQENDLKNYSYQLPLKFETYHPHKKAEFIASRLAMEALFKELGITFPAPVRLSSLPPSWPSGYLGSLAHTKGLAIVALASEKKLKGVGVDCERMERCEQVEKIWDKISNQVEREFFKKNGWHEPHWKLVLFSVKEALYKAAYPRVQEYFGFEQAQIVGIYPETQELILQSEFLEQKVPGTRIHARYDLNKDGVKTLVLMD